MEKNLAFSEWIWNSSDYLPDEYAEFKFNFNGNKNKRTIFNIASDSLYNLYINGKLVSFGQYADYPDYKVYDSIDITDYVEKENRVEILVWYFGIDTQNYIKDAPGVIFEVSEDGKVIEKSGAHIKSRLCPHYAAHREKRITSQLGLSFKYFANADENAEYTDSAVISKSKNLFVRPNERLILRERVKTEVTYLADGSYLVDLGKETCGFLDLDFESSEEQEILIAYGQFLDNGAVKRIIAAMDFSVEYVAKRGANEYMNAFRRLSGIYLQIFAKKPVKINYVGIRPVEYPVTAKKPEFKSELRNRIYDTSVRTLHNCMHEHYEDTPWREQALYIMDSRNEMLCTYYAFNDFKFARSNLTLISKGQRKDGLLSICYPAGRDIPIPFFSLIYATQIYEYVEYSGDETVVDEVMPVVDKIVKTYISKIGSNNLIADFPYPCWNFYEWSEGSNNAYQIDRKAEDVSPRRHALALNCMFLICLSYYKKLCAVQGRTFDFDETAMRNAIKDTFYVKEKGLFKATDENESFYSMLGNSLAVLCGIGDKNTVKNMLKDKSVVPITLSMSTFLYESLLKVDADYYKNYIVEDIDSRYGKMLEKGATTFWETELGASALGHTGSLCHGWSAMPIYYYSVLNGKDYFNGNL